MLAFKTLRLLARAARNAVSITDHVGNAIAAVSVIAANSAKERLCASLTRAEDAARDRIYDADDAVDAAKKAQIDRVNQYNRVLVHNDKLWNDLSEDII